ncbi:hypothetical protein FRC03_011726 [Tulasnella sp. 419]|nr:hypothetical protein FRC03_011726 [Tulasnella sp. 419]
MCMRFPVGEEYQEADMLPVLGSILTGSTTSDEGVAPLSSTLSRSHGADSMMDGTSPVYNRIFRWIIPDKFHIPSHLIFTSSGTPSPPYS